MVAWTLHSFTFFLLQVSLSPVFNHHVVLITMSLIIMYYVLYFIFYTICVSKLSYLAVTFVIEALSAANFQPPVRITLKFNLLLCLSFSRSVHH